MGNNLMTYHFFQNVKFVMRVNACDREYSNNVYMCKTKRIYVKLTNPTEYIQFV